MINLSQWKANIVKPHLTMFASIANLTGRFDADWAINQVTGTTKESDGCTYVVQLDGGPAVGFYQMEPNTHDDIWTNFLDYEPILSHAMYSVIGRETVGVGSADEMIGDLIYATLMCRVDYYRNKLAAPLNTAIGLATYWKDVYNTAGGAGQVDSASVGYFQDAISA
jgi:hypothetical protein